MNTTNASGLTRTLIFPFIVDNNRLPHRWKGDLCSSQWALQVSYDSVCHSQRAVTEGTGPMVRLISVLCLLFIGALQVSAQDRVCHGRWGGSTSSGPWTTVQVYCSLCIDHYKGLRFDKGCVISFDKNWNQYITLKWKNTTHDAIRKIYWTIISS